MIPRSRDAPGSFFIRADLIFFLHMLLKCRYIDELTDSRGVVFATGTPVSNSMTELYTMMRYLQHDTIRNKGLAHFDCWASTFGETTTAIELAPEGYNLVGR